MVHRGDHTHALLYKHNHIKMNTNGGFSVGSVGVGKSGVFAEH